MNPVYFRLHPFCYFVNESQHGCIYDTNQGRMIELDSENSQIILNCEANVPVTLTDRAFLEKLQELNLGTFYESLPFIDTFINDNKKIKSMMFPENHYLYRMFISLTNRCNLNCCFCSEDYKLFRKTGCKKWPLNHERQLLDREQWYSLIRSFCKLGGDELLFIGGEPLLQKELLLDLIRFSRNNHIHRFTVYTNGQLLDEETLKLFSSYQVKVKLQISSLDDDTNESITGVRYGYKEIIGLIENMLDAFIEVQPVLLVSRYNEHQVEKTIADLKKISSKLKLSLDFLYPKPANPHYSSKWEGTMYEKTKQFGKVSIEKLNHLRIYNECLYGQVAVTETGEVLPCPMMRDLSLGNIASDELVNILNESNYNDFISMNKDQVGKCSGCSFRYNCSDCRALERAATGQFEQMEYCCVKL